LLYRNDHALALGSGDRLVAHERDEFQGADPADEKIALVKMVLGYGWAIDEQD
jgi:hypothetical protein